MKIIKVGSKARQTNHGIFFFIIMELINSMTSVRNSKASSHGMRTQLLRVINLAIFMPVFLVKCMYYELWEKILPLFACHNNFHQIMHISIFQKVSTFEDLILCNIKSYIYLVKKNTYSAIGKKIIMRVWFRHLINVYMFFFTWKLICFWKIKAIV